MKVPGRGKADTLSLNREKVNTRTKLTSKDGTQRRHAKKTHVTTRHKTPCGSLFLLHDQDRCWKPILSPYPAFTLQIIVSCSESPVQKTRWPFCQVKLERSDPPPPQHPQDWQPGERMLIYNTDLQNVSSMTYGNPDLFQAHDGPGQVLKTEGKKVGLCRSGGEAGTALSLSVDFVSSF